MRAILIGNLTRPLTIVLTPEQARRLGLLAPVRRRRRWWQLWRTR